MIVSMVYRMNDEMTREAEGWRMEFERRSGREVKIVNPDTREGVGFCEARGIDAYPAIVVEKEEDGKVSMFWQVTQGMWPRIDDVIAYL